MWGGIDRERRLANCLLLMFVLLKKLSVLMANSKEEEKISTGPGTSNEAYFSRQLTSVRIGESKCLVYSNANPRNDLKEERRR